MLYSHYKLHNKWVREMGLFRRIVYYITGGAKKQKPSGSAKFIGFDTSKIAKTLTLSMKPAQHYIIRKDGKYFIYDSLDEMDAETKAEIATLEDHAPFNVFIEGERKTYDNFEDIPEEIRDTLKKFDKKKK